MKKWILTLAVATAATRLPAPPVPVPVPLELTITLTSPHTVTINGNGGIALAETYLLQSTNLASTNWTAVATNYETGTYTLQYSEIPVPTSPVFFRVEVFQ